MKKINKLVATLAIVVLGTTACQRNLSSASYTEGSTAGIVLEGTVVSARVVEINQSDKLGQGSGVGTLGGGLAGGIGGAQIGKGSGSAAAAVGGAVAGAVLGNLIEREMNRQTGMEYLIKLSPDSIDDAAQVTTKNINLGSSDIQGKIVNSSKTQTKTSIISVLQGLDNPVQVGQKVYVIYSDDRPRVVPAF